MNIPPDDASHVEAEAKVAALVARARGGDEDAFGELVRLHHERVYAVVYRVVRQADDAREVAQLAWVKAWQRLGSYKEESKFFTWLYRIAVNTALDHLRQVRRKREVGLEDEYGREARPAPEWSGGQAQAPDEEAAQDDVRRVFREALDRLSPEHRTALVLREVEGRPYKEIAQAMGCRIGTVMSRIFYARRLIQEHMRSVR